MELECNLFNDNKDVCNGMLDSNNLNKCVYDNDQCLDIENIYAKNFDLYKEIMEIQSNTNFLFGNVPRIDKKPKKNINIDNLFVLIDMFYIELYNLYTKNDGNFFLNKIENYRQNIIYKLYNGSYSNNQKIIYCNYYNKILRKLFKTRGINFYGKQSVEDTKKKDFFKKTILKLLFIYDYHNKDDDKEEEEEEGEREEEEDEKDENLEYIIQNNKSFNYINQYYNPDSISTLFLTKKILLNDVDKNELKNIVEHINYPTNEELKFLENLGMHSNLAHFVFYELIRVPKEVLYYKYIGININDSFYLQLHYILNKEIYNVIIIYFKLFNIDQLKYMDYEEFKTSDPDYIIKSINIYQHTDLTNINISEKNIDSYTKERFYSLLTLFLYLS